MNCLFFLLIISAIAGIYIGFLIQRPVSLLCDTMKCPYCYGTDLCEDVANKRITLQYRTFQDLFYNLFSVKNLYVADYEGTKVVLKKLGHQSELDNVIKLNPVTKEHILNFINSADSVSVANLRTCSGEVTEVFVDKLEGIFRLEELWTLIQINPEPLILSIFKNEHKWPVPHLFGACGSVIVEKHCGLPLNYFRTSDWHKRAFLALQLLEAAVNFTRKHKDFRLYLTDISPDNIAVDDDFNLYFIDVENVIVKQKLAGYKGATHYSRHFDEDDFVYSEADVCEHEISDHNVYAVCKLLLSRKAPWPMMTNGLLHTPPLGILSGYSDIFNLIEECVDSNEKTSRFDIAEELINLLKNVTNQ